MAGSYERLQLNLLKIFDEDSLMDTVLIVQGREIRCHRCVLAAQSTWFKEQFTTQAIQDKITIQDKKYKVMQALVRFMYFGGISTTASGSDFTPEDGLDMLTIAEEFGITALSADDIYPFIMPNLNIQNSIAVLQHEGLQRYPALQDGVCEFIGANFRTMMQTMPDQLMAIPRQLFARVLKTACGYITTAPDAQATVQFSLQHTQLESACDLLRETKQWDWGNIGPTVLKSVAGEEPQEGPEWNLMGVRAAMESTPARIVVGTFFDWCIRLDYGAEGKLRIVYESATPREELAAEPRCINRFPAAMFAWRVVYRGQDVFHEKPVFICFPENVSLHWSTTLPVVATELQDDDSLQIMVQMSENPMLSLVLYYFSADFKGTVFAEDILNRLPHIEYRCLSSYSLVKHHMQDDAK